MFMPVCLLDGSFFCDCRIIESCSMQSNSQGVFFRDEQVGYIQVGSEQMQIQPVNITDTSFDGKEHFIRSKRSTRSAHPAKSGIPVEHCRVVAGGCTNADVGSHWWS